MTGSPRTLHVLLEGDTEQRILENVFRPYWEASGWIVSGSIVETGKSSSGTAFRGGVSRWSKLERNILSALSDRYFSVVTTLIDYYRFPMDSPGMRDRPAGATAQRRVEHVEAAIAKHCDDRRFIPHLTLHEAETWVFAAGRYLADVAGDARLHGRLQADIRRAGGPENVNDGFDTAPSKRLLRYWSRYDKVLDGPLAVAEFGLAGLRQECPHLDAWLTTIEARMVE